MGITLVSLGVGTVTMTRAAAADSEVTNDSASQLMRLKISIRLVM
nr:hypothetical protein [Lactiplantibacillus plantarum]